MRRQELIEQYINGPSRVEKRLAELPSELMHFKPSPGAWSAHEIIIHLADAEVSGYSRVMKIVAEPGVTVDVYNQDSWTDVLKSSTRSVKNAMVLLKALRVSAHEVISNVSDEVWTHEIDHPEGGKYNLEKWLKSYVNHIDIHLKQISRNLVEWEKAGRPATS